MNRLFNNRGLTLVEVIMTLAILGVVICPLMNLLVVSQKINNEGENEFESIQTAQYYMEEIRARDGIDTGQFVYYAEQNSYERIINEPDNKRVEIRIKVGNYGLHYIEVDIIRDGEIINRLKGSAIYE